MKFFSTDMFKGETLQNKLKNLTNPFKSLANSAKTLLLHDDSKETSPDLIFIYPRIFWMTYPSKEKIEELSKTLETRFPKGSYYIWNVSEHKYDTSYFNNQVAEYSFVGYPCPPLEYVLIIIRSIIEWLNSDSNNVAIIHCQSTKGRSALIISCLLSALKVVNHPLEALTYFCNKLHVNDMSFLFPSQNAYLKDVANLMDGVKLNPKTYILQKVVINEVPKLKPEDLKTSENKEPTGFRPYLQIFKGSEPIYNSLAKEKPRTYQEKDNVIWFDVDVELMTDVLIRCRHFLSQQERVSIFRILFHPAFAFTEVVRFFKRDIDFSPDVEVSDNFFIDLILKPTESTNTGIALTSLDDNKEIATLEALKADCEKFSQEYQSKKAKEKFLTPQKIVIKNEDKQQQQEIEENPLKDVYDKSTEESDDKSPKKGNTIDRDKVDKLLSAVELNGENEEQDEEDAEEYLRKLEENN